MNKVAEKVDVYSGCPILMAGELGKAKKLIDEYCRREFGSGADFGKLPIVGLAYTEACIDEAEEEPVVIQVNADLQNYRIITEVNGKTIEIEQYESMGDFIEYALTFLEFDSLVSIPEAALKAVKK